MILGDELLVTVCCYRVVHHGCDVAVDSAVVVLAVSYKLVSGHAGAGVSCPEYIEEMTFHLSAPSSSPLDVRTLSAQVMIVM